MNQSDHQKSKVEGHIQICRRAFFKIFPFLQICSNDTDLRRACETKFQTEYETKVS